MSVAPTRSAVRKTEQSTPSLGVFRRREETDTPAAAPRARAARPRLLSQGAVGMMADLAFCVAGAGVVWLVVHFL